MRTTVLTTLLVGFRSCAQAQLGTSVVVKPRATIGTNVPADVFRYDIIIKVRNTSNKSAFTVQEHRFLVNGTD